MRLGYTLLIFSNRALSFSESGSLVKQDFVLVCDVF